MITDGIIYGINKNMITVEFKGDIRQNEVAHVIIGDQRLKSEVVRIRENLADLQVFEDTKGLKRGDKVEFSGELLTVQLGPGLLGQLFDGLQNPLHKLAEQYGQFLKRGKAVAALSAEQLWLFSPALKPGAVVRAGETLGTVPEALFEHQIMVPFNLTGIYEVVEIADRAEYRVNDKIALLKDGKGNLRPLSMNFFWPVRQAVNIYQERLRPVEPLISQIRIIDTMFPVAKGGTFCIPGPFGAGKTVLQQLTSRNAQVDIVIIAACGERAGEVVETIRQFPQITDPLTGRSLMERTIIVGNTSSMPVAARESSVYTAVTMAEYYRQMGLDVLLLADSTSRWAQAMRERSGRLEEIPGEEAFPAYLESIIASFYERAGLVRLRDGRTGSVTIGGTVSPAGGNFDEPVTQATLKVVGAFHGLSRERSDARHYPAIDPLTSWSRYQSFIGSEQREMIIKLLSRANEIEQMMKVVGEEGTSIADFLIYLKGLFFDGVYLQQNGFDPVDGATSKERQSHVFELLEKIISGYFAFDNKDEARAFFQKLRLSFLNLNSAVWDSDDFSRYENQLAGLISESCQQEEDAIDITNRQAFMEQDFDSTFIRARSTRTLKDGMPLHHGDDYRGEDADDLQ
ncbi:MAG: V-type ATP synthase subunit A [Deltaproteobacteria bacterium]|nr:V-type ATP synthase subunit A [Deltaproteobacteria bacterium]